jgi:hypothetical protein
VPFAAAPEIGLRTSFAIDSPDPRVTQQRFDLYLAAKVAGELTRGLAARIETRCSANWPRATWSCRPVRRSTNGMPFRGGFNQLLYTRFGLTVDDCVPVDLGDTRDYARELLARAVQEPAPPAAVPARLSPCSRMARPLRRRRGRRPALRRLFLELPCVMCGVRLAALPPGRRCSTSSRPCCSASTWLCLARTMPALALAAPGQPLGRQQLRRARHSLRACKRARRSLGAAGAPAPRPTTRRSPLLFDEADRIVANLERDCAERRAARRERRRMNAALPSKRPDAAAVLADGAQC